MAKHLVNLDNIATKPERHLVSGPMKICKLTHEAKRRVDVYQKL